jgi:adenine-specific DNA-methyltransferase
LGSFIGNQKDSCHHFPFSVDTTTEGKKFPFNNAGNNLAVLRFPPGSVSFLSIEDSCVKAQDMSEGAIKTKLIKDLIIKDGLNFNELVLEGEWRYSQDTLNSIIEAGDTITVSKIPFRPNHVKRGGDIKKMKNSFTPNHYSMETNEDATSQVIELFGVDLFDNPKPRKLISTLIQAVTHSEKDSIILDFFSGSATTADALMNLNAKDNSNRKYIMVQLPAPIDPSKDKAVYDFIKDELKVEPTIAEIGKERIRRAGKKILKEQKTKSIQLKLGEEARVDKELDIGFRVYKLDSSNMKDIYYHPSKIDQKQLSLFTNNIKEDRTPEDLLCQVILDLGLELHLKIESKNIYGNNVYFVETNSLVACFDEAIDFRIIDEIAQSKPLKVVFRDASFKNDKDRINLEERFKRLSAETIIKVI